MLDIVTSDILKNWIEVGEKTVLMRHVCRLGKTFPGSTPHDLWAVKWFVLIELLCEGQGSLSNKELL